MSFEKIKTNKSEVSTTYNTETIKQKEAFILSLSLSESEVEIIKNITDKENLSGEYAGRIQDSVIEIKELGPNAYSVLVDGQEVRSEFYSKFAKEFKEKIFATWESNTKQAGSFIASIEFQDYVVFNGQVRNTEDQVKYTAVIEDREVKVVKDDKGRYSIFVDEYQLPSDLYTRFVQGFVSRMTG